MSGISEYEVQFWNRLNKVKYSQNNTIAGMSLYVELNKEFPILKCLPQDFNTLLHNVYTNRLGDYMLQDIIAKVRQLKEAQSVKAFTIRNPLPNWESVSWSVINDKVYCTVYALECSMVTTLPHDITMLAIMLHIIANCLKLLPRKLLYASATATIADIDLYNKANYNLFCVKQASAYEPCDTLPSKVYYSSPQFEICGGLSVREKFDTKIIKLTDYICM